jgi:6-phospho-beta-glucosidase
MARIKLVYIGGGSTRAPGTVASIVKQAEAFAGSEVVLVDLNPEHLEIVRSLAERMAKAAGVEITVSATTDLEKALPDCDAVLSSFRPGGFEARRLDERIPLKHDVIGQETQGPGGFFMALRTIHVTRTIAEQMERLSPRAILFNYTNPVNIVAEAVSHYSGVRVVSLCDGPVNYPREMARNAGLDPTRVKAVMAGLNHGSWTVRQSYDGDDLMPLLEEAYERDQRTPALSNASRQMLGLAIAMRSIPASYFRYYYFRDEVLAEQKAKPTTRAEDILAEAHDYWAHYRQQAASDNPTLDPAKSRGGVLELELAIDVMDSWFNDRGETWPVNVPNHGSIDDLPGDRVVETVGRVDRSGVTPLPLGPLPRGTSALLQSLSEYQSLAAEAAWCGTRREAVLALAANPLVLDYPLAERLYDEMAAAHRQYLPERLLR